MLKKLYFLLIIVAFTGCKSNQETTPEIHGVWIAAPEHNTLMHSYANLVKGVSELNELGINYLFVCTWADNKTGFNSKVLLENSNYTHIDSTNLFTPYNYTSKTNDPITDLITEAHKYGMKVIFWFEYGFMARWGAAPTPGNNPVLAKHPHWVGLDNEGNPCSYNNSDYYFNAYHPAVQEFILSLVDESLTLYPEVDGVQGDDRLPASPINSGYDKYTTMIYNNETSGKTPPKDYLDEEWLNWRLNILNNFGVRFYERVKKRNPDYLVAFSPNPYPWCKENLMQDWPSWIEDGIVELLAVQCYRTDIESYKNTVNEALSYAQESGLDKKLFTPGILLGIGSGKSIEPANLDSILMYNESLNIAGQNYFYAKWILEDDSFKQIIEKN